jgi:hypothetical protein
MNYASNSTPNDHYAAHLKAFQEKLMNSIMAALGVPRHLLRGGDDCPCESCQFERAGRKLELLSLWDMAALPGLTGVLRKIGARCSMTYSDIYEFWPMLLPPGVLAFTPERRSRDNTYWTRGDIEAWIEANR